MQKIVSIFISIFSLIIGIIIMVGAYVFYGKQGFLEGAPAWILGPLGAPMTYLSWIIAKVGLSKSIISQYCWICFLYVLQYQIIALLIYKGIIELASKKGIIFLVLIIFVILISAVLMFSIIMGFWSLWGLKEIK